MYLTTVAKKILGIIWFSTIRLRKRLPEGPSQSG
jgi:hypothetical protein